MDDLKGFGAATASSGATALFHIVGITPEAPTLASCLKKDTTVQTITVSPEALRSLYQFQLEICRSTSELIMWPIFFTIKIKMYLKDY